MNCSKIAAEIRFNHLSISQISEKYNIPKADVVQSIYKFFSLFPDSSHNASINRRFRSEIAKEFLKSNASTLDFAEEYGFRVEAFRKLIREIVNDTSLIASDAIADRLFLKVMDRCAIIVKYVPERIVKQIAYYYVCEKSYKIENLANIYGTRTVTIAAILRRGIAENIVDDVTAEKIVLNVKSHCTCIEAYHSAFEQRAKLKAEQS